MIEKEKKIAIITCGLQNNYGAVLQSLATQNVLNSMGNDTVLINYNWEKDKSYLPFNQRHIKSFIACILFFKLRKSIYVSFQNFRFNNIKYSLKKIRTEYDLTQELKKYEVVIIGSDQVWSPYSEINKHYTLLDMYDHGAGPKRISYASSFGVREIPTSMREMYKRGLSQFDFLSVREESGKKIIQELIDKEVEVTIDPVFLMNLEEWEEYEQEVEYLKGKKYILVYDLWHSKELRCIAKRMSDLLNCEIYVISAVTFKDRGFHSLYGIGPGHFLWLIKNATYVVTDSFHGTAFSIIFNKNFWTYCSQKSDYLSDRIKFLLKKLQLKDRLAANEDYISVENIDFKNANSLVDLWKKKSMVFLEKAI